MIDISTLFGVEPEKSPAKEYDGTLLNAVDAFRAAALLCNAGGGGMEFGGREGLANESGYAYAEFGALAVLGSLFGERDGGAVYDAMIECGEDVRYCARSLGLIA